MKNTSVLGCGWLGFPLAEALLDRRSLERQLNSDY